MGILSERTVEFAVNIVKYSRWLCAEEKDYVLSNQILKSGTSIGANVYEANYASSKADFINKMQIALKETSETEYWLIILEKSKRLPQNYSYLKENVLEIKKMLISSINTSKK